VNLAENAFEGLTDFSQLPQSYMLLDIRDTTLEGEVRDLKGTVEAAVSKVTVFERKSEDNDAGGFPSSETRSFGFGKGN